MKTRCKTPDRLNDPRAETGPMLVLSLGRRVYDLQAQGLFLLQVLGTHMTLSGFREQNGSILCYI